MPMKTLSSLSLLLVTSAALLDAQRVGEKIADTGDARLPKEVQSAQRASEYAGQRVWSSDGHEVGSVDDFVIEARSGQVLYAVVKGGVLGVGGSARVVPMSALQRGEDGKGFALPVDEGRWKQAPGFDKEQIGTLALNQRGRETFEFFGATPDEANDEQSLRQPRLVLASQVRGREVKNGEQGVGEAEDVVIDFNSRRASVLLDGDDGYVGADGDFVLPFREVAVERGGDELGTRLQRSDFENAKPFDQMAWTGSDAGAVYRWEARTVQVGTYVSPEDAAAADDPALSGQTRMTTALPDPTNPDLQRVRTAIGQDMSLAGSVQDVTVEEENGAYVLGGSVASEELKRKVEERARRAAQGSRIENRIQAVDR